MPLVARTIFLRFFWGMFIIFLLLFSTALAFIFHQIQGFYRLHLIGHLNALALSLSDQIAPLLKDLPDSYDLIDQFAKLHGPRLGVRITVIDVTGRVLGDSEENPRLMENHANRPEVRQALVEGQGSSFRFSTTVERTLLYYAVKVNDGDNTLGVLRISLFADQIQPVLKSLKGRMIKTGIAVILIAAILAFIYGKYLYRPIGLIGQALEELASGNFTVRLPSNLTGEMGTIARSINETARRLKTLFGELERERKELKSIVESLGVGVLVMDPEGRILMMNESLRATGLPACDACDGMYYWECFRAGEVNEFIKEAKKKVEVHTKELSFYGKSYVVTATPLSKGEKILITFQDISTVKETERIKRDLVSNVSHEIKTPLTAIRGYVETLLEEEEDETKKHHLSVINRHVNRLSKLAENLITLHELEVNRPLEEVPVKIGAIIHRVVELYRAQAEKKGLSLEVYVLQDMEIMVDPLKLEELLINLLDNAVRYTKEGRVKISFYEGENQEAIISVSDTGIGIPPEHIPRIFERFYVVDKSRSRETGGTGLGLSIVKHIVERLGGTISVESTPAKGSTFTVRLPGWRIIKRSPKAQ